jgi:hypothetical protein
MFISLPMKIVTKQEAAKRQLLTAIELFLQDGDCLSIFNLTSAVFMVTENLACKTEEKPQTFWEFIKPYASTDEFKAMKYYMGNKAGFLKHANQQEEEFVEFTEMNINAFLCMAIHNYQVVFDEIAGGMNIPYLLFCARVWDEVKDRQFDSVWRSAIQKLAEFRIQSGDSEAKFLALEMFYRDAGTDVNQTSIARLLRTKATLRRAV